MGYLVFPHTLLPPQFHIEGPGHSKVAILLSSNLLSKTAETPAGEERFIQSEFLMGRLDIRQFNVRPFRFGSGTVLTRWKIRV